ncbi:MAG: hypothetical protein IT460_10925 [Planctomycetes bacterium]|nr:hypothetical protein [Planctomycetota bacterium]
MSKGPIDPKYVMHLPPAQDQGLVPSCAAWAVWLAATYRQRVLSSPTAGPTPNASYLMNLALWEKTANQLSGWQTSRRSAVTRQDLLSYLSTLGSVSSPGTSGGLGTALAAADLVMKYLARSGSVDETAGPTPYCDAQPEPESAAPQGTWTLHRDWPYLLNWTTVSSKNSGWATSLAVALQGSSNVPPMPVVALINPGNTFATLGQHATYVPGPPIGPSHYVVIVAMAGSGNSVQYLMRNSWGTNWGNGGDFVMSSADFTTIAKRVYTLVPLSPATPTPVVPSNFAMAQGSGWTPAAGGDGWDPAGALKSAAGSHSFTNGVVPWISDLSAAPSSVGAKLRAPGGHPHTVPTPLALRAPAVPFVPALAGYQVKWSAGLTAANLFKAVASGAPVELGGATPWKGVFTYWDHVAPAVPPGTGPDPDETGIYVDRATFQLVPPPAGPSSPRPASLVVQAEVLLPGQTSSALRRTWNVSVI